MPLLASFLSGFQESQWDMYDLIEALWQAPSYHLLFEVFLMVWIVFLITTKSYKKTGKHRATLTEKEKDDLIRDWEPEPLVPYTDPDHPTLQNFMNRIVESKANKNIVVNGAELLNVASLNFLSMVGRPEIEEAAIKSLRKYGVGSCGPRGFYGTVDVHLTLEERLAQFTGTEEAIIYSYGFATISSAIPAYSKRGDVIFCDEGVNFSILQGLRASRSKLVFFKHNDMEDLENCLKVQAQEDKKNPKKAKATRRFLVVEGLYINYGDLCPLPKLMELKEKYKVRVFMDESVSFGTVGTTGRGVTEYFSVNINDVELISASLENAIGAAGGFCCGKSYVIDHQRLSGLGYCFSASAPPMLSQAAISALEYLDNNPGIVSNLQSNAVFMHENLKQLPKLKVVGSPESPIQHLQLAQSSGRPVDSSILQQIVQLAERNGVALTMAAYLEEDERFLPPPSIRVAVTTDLTDEDMLKCITVLNECIQQYL